MIFVYKSQLVMNNLYKYKILFIVIFCTLFGRQLVGTAIENRRLMGKNRAFEGEISKLDSWTARTPSRCQAIGSKSREIYSFETQDYYINICKLGETFYYRRQSKNDVETLLIPAEVVFRGDVFQATNKETTYFVGKNGDRHYSSVMQNNNEIVFEPELQQPIAVSSELPAANIAADNSKEGNNIAIKIDSSQNNSQESVGVCTSEESASHPSLDGWHKLLGKTPAIANTYATDNGHNFIYSDRNPSKASIATKDGAVVNLNIAAVSETIERVCVRS